MASQLLAKHPRLLDTVDRAARERLICFTQLCDPDYEATKFHKYLAETLERVEAGTDKRVIITVPPRHGKSRLTSVELPAWMLGRNPKKKIILASYATRLAKGHSTDVRNRLLESPEYQRVFPSTIIRRDNRSAIDWKTTAGGGFLAAGVGSGVTGRGADLIIVDDPFADYEEAHSETIRESVWNWFQSTLYTRLTADGRIVIIMTRWHTDDLVGRLIDPIRAEQIRQEGGDYIPWKVINLPALAEEADILGREPGEALFPEHFGVGWLKNKRAEIGSYLFSALFMGNPVPKGGNYINGKNFMIVPPESIPSGMILTRFWDIATDEKTSADFTAGARGGIDANGNFWIVNIMKGQWKWPESRSRIAATADIEGGRIGFEAQGGFKTAGQNLREVLPATISLTTATVDKDKLLRALPWIAMVENKRVFLVQGLWNGDFLRECEAFPAGKHDDQVDAVSGLYKMVKTTRIAFA